MESTTRFSTSCLCLGAVCGLLLIAGCGEPSAESEYREFDESSIQSARESSADNADADEASTNDDGQAVAKTNDASGEVDAEEGSKSRDVNDAPARQVAAVPPAPPLPRETETEAPPAVQEVSTSSPAKIELLVKDKEFAVEGPDGALRVTYDDLDLLKVLNMDPVPEDAVDYFPKWLHDLDGKRIRLRGFMYPTFQDTGIQAFMLARDNQICCFGRNPKIYDLVTVRMRESQTTDYIQNRPFDVVGTFRINPLADAGELVRLYRIEDAIVIDR